MKRVIIFTLVGLIVGWPSFTEAKTTYLICNFSDEPADDLEDAYKLEEPRFGEAKFYKMGADQLVILKSKIDEDFIQYSSANTKEKSPEMNHSINRATGKVYFRSSKTGLWSYWRVCKFLNSPS